MVRVAGLHGTRPPPGSTAGRPTAARPSRRSPRRACACSTSYGRQSQPRGVDELCPALAAEGIVVTSVDDLNEEERAELDDALRARDLSRADAARGRARPAVPVHLAPLGQPRALRRRPGHGRGALRARQGAGRPAALPAARPARRGSCRSSRCSPTTCRASSPGWTCASGRSSASRATPTSRSRTRPTTCSRRSSSSCAARASAR